MTLAARVAGASLMAGVALSIAACGGSTNQPSTAGTSARPSSSSPAAVDAAPHLVSSKPEIGYKGQRRVGLSVPPSAVAERVDAGHVWYGLAACGDFQGTSYPASSNDGGKTWHTVGPELWRAAAQGAKSVSDIVASGRLIMIWGSSIVSSADGGRTWRRTFIGQGIRTIRVNGSRAVALAQFAPVAGQPTRAQTVRYRTTDGGRTWRLWGGSPPTPEGPVMPKGPRNAGCG
jgi:hypothetical protein